MVCVVDGVFVFCIVFVCTGFSLALTNLCFREGFDLYAINGGEGKICFKCGLFLISVHCLLKIPLILWILSENHVTNSHIWL